MVLKKKSKSKSQDNSSKKVLGMLGVNFCFVKYSEVEDLRLRLNDVSLAASKAAKSLAAIKLMCLRPEEREESFAKLTDMSDTKQNKQSITRDSEPDAFGRDTAKTLKYSGIRFNVLPSGQSRKSRKR